MCVCVCMCMCVCMRACVRGCVMCVWVGVGVFVWCVRTCRRVLCITLALFSLSVQPCSSPSFRVYWTHPMASRPTDPYAGEHCKKIGLTIEQFYRATTSPPMVKIVNIENGLIYELSQYESVDRPLGLLFTML